MPLLLAASGANAATTNCSTVAACVFGNNTSSSGIGVQGSSASTGTGVKGTSSSTGHGVDGISKYGFGVVGISVASNGKAGVEGIDSNNGYGGYNSGVYGSSYNGAGVQGVALTNGTALKAVVNYGGYILLGFSNYSGGSNYPEVSIDSYGNMILSGNLTTYGTPAAVTTGSNGVSVSAFGARTTSPTLEDTGEATLSRGQAYVALEPMFASTIDRTAKYQVFVTPQGDTHGLYVTQITSNGFAVRESAGGRSSVAFDYRIVAKPYDTKLCDCLQHSG